MMLTKATARTPRAATERGVHDSATRIDMNIIIRGRIPRMHRGKTVPEGAATRTGHAG
ncbi:MAG: hypothetical protein QGM46_05710 [Actinomycetota bacterium]|nr:hypothetical protein [Actinomycetota bacterium]MDK1017753.1 hypothetical protein [Actinomycetota bacterium]MDK1027490.1 hypothetical protein [Actinomycetota bacterium]MDK1037723.1 hypothetical protein [Actinomycetota bacterium]MDK1095994.1 hypothetical protein [Actinomycetota bacterium]